MCGLRGEMGDFFMGVKLARDQARGELRGVGGRLARIVGSKSRIFLVRCLRPLSGFISVTS